MRRQKRSQLFNLLRKDGLQLLLPLLLQRVPQHIAVQRIGQDQVPCLQVVADSSPQLRFGDIIIEWCGVSCLNDSVDYHELLARLLSLSQAALSSGQLPIVVARFEQADVQQLLDRRLLQSAELQVHALDSRIQSLTATANQLDRLEEEVTIRIQNDHNTDTRKPSGLEGSSRYNRELSSFEQQQQQQHQQKQQQKQQCSSDRCHSLKSLLESKNRRIIELECALKLQEVITRSETGASSVAAELLQLLLDTAPQALQLASHRLQLYADGSL